MKILCVLVMLWMLISEVIGITTKRSETKNIALFGMLGMIGWGVFVIIYKML